MDLTLLRKEIQEKIKTEVIERKIVVYREELQGNIEFNVAGIKECINQPCSPDPFSAKLSLISESLIKSLTEAEYIGYTDYQTHPKPHVRGYYYFKTYYKGIELYFNIQFTVQKKFILYTITEKVQI